MIYIRRRLGGRVDARDGRDEYTWKYLTYPKYLVELVELELAADLHPSQQRPL